MKRVRKSEMLAYKLTRERIHSVRSAENIDAVAESLFGVPWRSTRYPFTKTGQFNHFWWAYDLKILSWSHMKQQLKPVDHPLGQMIINSTNNIISSDEAHCHLGGYANKQNYLVWGRKNAHIFVEKILIRWHTGRFCFENDKGATVTVNGEHYRPMFGFLLNLKVRSWITFDFKRMELRAIHHMPQLIIFCLQSSKIEKSASLGSNEADICYKHSGNKSRAQGRNVCRYCWGKVGNKRKRIELIQWLVGRYLISLETW